MTLSSEMNQGGSETFPRLLSGFLGLPTFADFSPFWKLSSTCNLVLVSRDQWENFTLPSTFQLLFFPPECAVLVFKVNVRSIS